MIIPKICQTCNTNNNIDKSFCSKKCYLKCLQKHQGGGVLAIQMYEKEPCLIMIKDASRKENMSEIPGGQKKVNEGPAETSARETSEELGFRLPLSCKYLKKNSTHLVAWFSNKKYKYNYSVYLMMIENFNINEANLAAKSRLNDTTIEKDWRETAEIYLVPLKNLENYISESTNQLLDYMNNPIPPLSSRWEPLIKNVDTLELMKNMSNEYLNKQVIPWKLNIKNTHKNNSKNTNKNNDNHSHKNDEFYFLDEVVSNNDLNTNITNNNIYIMGGL